MFIQSKLYLVLLALLPAIFSPSVFAKDFVINVNGIVCEFCSIGVTKKVSKLSFIDKSKYNKGVKVQIKNQMVTIAVKDDALLDKDALYAAIESGGYNPVEIFELTENGEQRKYQP